MVEGYTVGWFTLALINAGLAQAKHASGLIAFIASLFLGPLATLFIVIFVDDEHKHDKSGKTIDS